MSRFALLAFVVVLTGGSAGAAVLRGGSWTNSYAGPGVGGPTTFRGQLNVDTGVVRGRIMGRRCPVRGRIQLTCDPLESQSRFCRGAAKRAGCSVEGFIYLQHFEGTWTCGQGTGGALSLGGF